ncbi:MAG TPA: 6-phosphofructokinase [Rubrivivax sp.]|nr:6-phosphofructokinase [Rubrivivax sp.]HPO18034.1 6-phosphofructokinase [Rubrivivax sp.]
MKRIAINFGGGLVPGLEQVLAGAVLAARAAGCEIVGIRDGYDGLLDDGDGSAPGLVRLDPAGVEAGAIRLGVAPRHDPFRMRAVNADGAIEEVDRSAELLQRLRQAGIDGVVSVTGASAVTGLHALSVAFKLHRRGLRTVCIPKAVENEIAGVPLAFGYDSVLANVAESLQRIRQGAHDVGRLAVVEVPGRHAGWLALQAGIAAQADAVLIPEIRYDVTALAAALEAAGRGGRRPSLVVVAEGAQAIEGATQAEAADPLRASLAPNADLAFGHGEHVIDRSGAAAKAVASALQGRAAGETMPMTLGLLPRGGPPTAVDRQLGRLYGAGAVRSLLAGEDGVLMSWQPPEMGRVPITEALQRVRALPLDGAFVRGARALGIALGDAVAAGGAR